MVSGTLPGDCATATHKKREGRLLSPSQIVEIFRCEMTEPLGCQHQQTSKTNSTEFQIGVMYVLFSTMIVSDHVVEPLGVDAAFCRAFRAVLQVVNFVSGTDVISGSFYVPLTILGRNSWTLSGMEICVPDDHFFPHLYRKLVECERSLKAWRML